MSDLCWFLLKITIFLNLFLLNFIQPGMNCHWKNNDFPSKAGGEMYFQ